jgi:transglutaminase-like putative cysteine protease
MELHHLSNPFPLNRSGYFLRRTYLGDIGVEPDPAPMDFNAWFEAYLEGGWYTFDARHNEPRIGRILISRGRDASDVAMITSFGPHCLKKFEVFTQELSSGHLTLAA